MIRKWMLTFVAFCVSGLLFGQTQDLRWMVGTWKIETPNGIIFESWKQLNDTTLAGKSVFIKSTDTIPQESLELKFRKGEWFYVSTVVGQNENKPVAFKLIFIGNQEFISENPAHDFPQRIAYRRVGTRIYASIEGKRRGKYSKQNFDFERE